MLGGTLAKCFQDRGWSPCCETDMPAKIPDTCSDFLVSAEDVRNIESAEAMQNSAELPRPLGRQSDSPRESVRETSSSPARGKLNEVPKLALPGVCGSLGQDDSNRGDSSSRGVHNSMRSDRRPPGDTSALLAEPGGDVSGRDLGRPRPGLGALLPGGGAGAQVVKPAPGAPPLSGREAEIQDLHNMIAALQTRLTEAESMGKTHHDSGQNDPAAETGQAAEQRARLAEDQARMLGLRVRALEEEKQGMQALMFRSRHQMQMLQADAAVYAEARRSQDKSPGVGNCFGPRRVCG